MPIPYYPGSLVTPNLGLSLVGMDVEVAENFVILDAAVGGGGGGGSTVRVNGTPITNPNFNGTTPAAPAGGTNVIWQFDLSGNVSAYVIGIGGTPGGLNTELQFNDNGVFGGTSGLDWDVVSTSVSGIFAFDPFTNGIAPVFVDVTTAIPFSSNNTPFCGANSGLAQGSYVFKYAYSDATNTQWSNVISYAFVIAPADDLQLFFEIDMDTPANMPPGAVPHGWISFNGGSDNEITGGCDTSYVYETGMYADGSVTFIGGLPVPTGAQLNTLLSTSVGPLVPLIIRDAAGNIHDQAIINVTTNNGADASAGTLEFIRRTYFDDLGTDAFSGFANSFVSIAHKAGIGTIRTNQDRALGVAMVNDASNPGTHGLETIQAQLTILGSPVAAGVDSEYTTLSLQLEDDHVGNISAAAYGANNIRATYFRQTDAAWGSNFASNARFQFVNNAADVLAGSDVFAQIAIFGGDFGSTTHLDYIGAYITVPSPRFGHMNTGLVIQGFSNASDRAITVTSGIVDLGTGATRVGSLVFPGSSSGSATVQVAAAAGTPNPLQLPTTTGTAGQALVTDGGNPQQLSWSTVSPVVASINQTGQTASIGTANIVASATAAVYRLDYYLKITTAGSTSGSVTLTLSYTDRDDSQVITFVIPTPANAVDSTGVVSGVLILDAKVATAITYATTYASSGGTPMQYKLRIKAEAL